MLAQGHPAGWGWDHEWPPTLSSLDIYDTCLLKARPWLWLGTQWAPPMAFLLIRGSQRSNPPLYSRGSGLGHRWCPVRAGFNWCGGASGIGERIHRYGEPGSDSGRPRSELVWVVTQSSFPDLGLAVTAGF